MGQDAALQQDQTHDGKPGAPGEGLARYSLYAPFVTGILQFPMWSVVRELETVRTIVDGFSILLIATGLLAAITALSKMDRKRRGPVLGRALVGLAINGFVVALAAYVYVTSARH